MRSFVLSLFIVFATTVSLQAGECLNGSCALAAKNAVVRVVEAPVHAVGNVLRHTVQTTKNVVCQTKQRTKRLFGRLRCL